MSHQIRVFFVFFSVFIATSSFAQICRQVRSSFDIGSSDTKVLSAVIDVCQKTVEKVLYSNRARIDFKGELLRGGDKNFSRNFLQDATKKIISMKASAEKIVFEFCAREQDKCAADPSFHAVLTSAFREAVNAQEFVAQLKQEANIEAEVISQKKEGLLAYLSVYTVARTQMPSGTTPLVIDIGGGSMQWSYMDNDKQFQTYGIEFGAKKIVKFVVENIRGKSMENLSERDVVNSIYPLTNKEIEVCSKFISKKLESVPESFVEKARTSPVIGVGGVLAIATPKIAGKFDSSYSLDQKALPSPIALQEINSGIDRFTLVNPDQIRAADAVYPESFVTNAILSKTILEKIGINKIQTLSVDLNVGEMISRE